MYTIYRDTDIHTYTCIRNASFCQLSHIWIHVDYILSISTLPAIQICTSVQEEFHEKLPSKASWVRVLGKLAKVLQPLLMLRARFELHHSQPKLQPKCDIMSIRPRTICLCLGIHLEASPKLSRKHPTPLANGPWLENVEDLSHVIPMDLSSFSAVHMKPLRHLTIVCGATGCYR